MRELSKQLWVLAIVAALVGWTVSVRAQDAPAEGSEEVQPPPIQRGGETPTDAAGS